MKGAIDLKKLGLFLIIVSFLVWVGVFAVPLLSLTIAQKATLATGLAILGELLFWSGALLVGKEVAARYKQWLNPRYLWKRGKQRLRR